jgi:hypothetical protein
MKNLMSVEEFIFVDHENVQDINIKQILSEEVYDKFHGSRFCRGTAGAAEPASFSVSFRV